MDTRLKIFMTILSFVVFLLGGWMFMIPVPAVSIAGAAMVFVSGFNIAFWLTRKDESG
jgi:small neutral amino acid transporter SnatA (MarC family)